MPIENPIKAKLLFPGETDQTPVDLRARVYAGDKINFVNGNSYIVDKVTVVMSMDFKTAEESYLLIQLSQ